MADTRGMQDLFGLDIDRLAKGFGEQKYTFLAECTVRKMKGDSVRWFQKTAGTLTADDHNVFDINWDTVGTVTFANSTVNMINVNMLEC